MIKEERLVELHKSSSYSYQHSKLTWLVGEGSGWKNIFKDI